MFNSMNNPETKLDEVIPFQKQSDDLKKKLAKNNKAKMVIYNALPGKDYERIFMCNTAKEIWKTLLITHQDESIDNAFARFNIIITSLKALDEVFDFQKLRRRIRHGGKTLQEVLQEKRQEPKRFVRGSWSDSGEKDDEKFNNETCLVAQASSEVSGMPPNTRRVNESFSQAERAYNRGNVIFGSNLRGNIIGKGQICDNKCRVTFSEHDSEITKDGKVIGLYQTSLPSPDDIISYIREDREGQVTRIRHKEEIESYVLYDRVMNPLTAQQERKTRKDHGTRRGRHSTSSSAFDQPSSSHLSDDDDGNDERTSRTSTSSPIRYVNSLTNEVPQVFQNHLILTPTWNHFIPAKPKSSTVKFKFEMSIMVD
ncbi:hypothetical protein Tco_1402133 [Tanacetum coccineum]